MTMNVSRSCCRRLRPVAMPFCPAPKASSFSTSSPARGRIQATRFRGGRGIRSANPELASYYTKMRTKKKTEKDRQEEGESGAEGAQPPLERGGLAENSILHEPIAQDSVAGTATYMYGHAIPRDRLMALDPAPKRRRRWERTKVIQEIRNRGRVPRALQLKRTERDFRLMSPLIRTSMKKLSPLANQIAGKPIDEAILQMRFSKKRAAIAVRHHLELARDRAIVEHGMGLGRAQGTTGERTKIRLKDGSPHEIHDRTAIYIAQAWVSKGGYGLDENRRARGRRDLLRLPQTSITVLLKEEATRVREYNEREEKEAARKPWIQMPDKPISAQRPYYTW